MRAPFLPALELLPNIGLIVVLGYGGHQVLDGALSLGQLVAFNVYVVMLIWPLRMLGMIIAQGQRAAASAERVHEVLDDRAPRSSTRRARDLRCRRPGHGGERVARSASRRCASATRPSCPVVSTASTSSCPPGQSVALVGADRVAARPPSPACSRASTTSTAAPCVVDGVDVRDAAAARAAQGRRHRVRGHVPVQRHASRANIAFADPDAAAGGHRARRPARRRPRVHRRAARRATTRRSASGASRCRAASASASPSPEPSSPTPAC